MSNEDFYSPTNRHSWKQPNNLNYQQANVLYFCIFMYCAKLCTVYKFPISVSRSTVLKARSKYNNI